MKKLVLILSALLFLIGTTDVQAQWGKKLLKKAGESAKRATERNVEQKVDKAVNKAFDGAEDAVTGKGNDSKSEKKTNAGVQGDAEVIGDDGDMAQEPQQPQQSLEMTYAKSDFVPGDEIIFEDDLATEQLGEFPSKWDLISDYAEVATFDGRKCINVETRATIMPLMKDMKNYLPEVFTLEMDYWATDETEGSNRERYEIYFYDANGKRLHNFQVGGSGWSQWWYKTPTGEDRNGSGPGQKLKPGAWHHLAFSFNKRAIKLYIDGIRVANIPSAAPPASLQIYMSHSVVSYQKTPTNAGITNIRMAKGAVPLYDRMMSDGKFITYGITFDVGKSTIKPESMGEINRIVTLMKENPDLKFSVEGHTDSTGNEASNQTLSEARSKAIVDKLIELGIATDRLTASGKGQSSPIADNGTDEGRAKNRRVEFVKL